MTKEISKTYIIYKITNIINGKIYIGVTRHSIEKRLIQHKSDAKRRKQCRLHNAMMKYGVDNFTIELIESIQTSDYNVATNREIENIKIYKSLDKTIGYNMTVGGEGVVGHTPWSKGKTKETDATMQKISEKQRGTGNSFYGKTHSNFLKQKWSKERVGENHPCFGKSRPDLILKNKNRVWTDEQKKAISMKNSCAIICNELGITYQSVTEMCEKLSLDIRSVHRVLNGKFKQHKGYTFTRVGK